MLYALASRANDRGECWPSVATLMADTGLSRRGVQTAIRALADDGRIAIRPGRKRTGRTGANVYRLTLRGAVSAPRSIEGETAAEGRSECARGAQ